MKKLFLIAAVVTFAAGFAGEVLPSRVKIDINGRNNNTSFSEVSVFGGLKNLPAKWVPEAERNRYLIFESGVLNDSWQEFEFSFVPDTTGPVRMLVRGNWTPKNGMIRLVAYDKFSFAGCAANNGDFETVKNNTISGWQLRDMNMCMDKADAGDGKNYVKCSHNYFITQTLHVKAGQKVTIRFAARAAETIAQPELTKMRYERMK
ncbi:MAG: hypothetical protein IKA71_02925 [Lentisphaeria bacterium]|nr:hypothetical protein [Lentisphaeria bacterium]